jgi:hypothetical protein
MSQFGGGGFSLPPTPWYKENPFWGGVGTFLAFYLTGVGIVSGNSTLAIWLFVVAWPCGSYSVWVAATGLSNKRLRVIARIAGTLSVALLLLLTIWLGRSTGKTSNNVSDIDDRNFLDVVTGWGVKPPPLGSTASEGYEDMNTTRLQPFKDKYDLMLVARPHDTHLSAFKDHNIQKSNPFPIPAINASPMRITVTLPSSFLTPMLSAQITELEFHLCLIPHEVDLSTIAELDDVAARGGHVFTPARGGGAGIGMLPPAPLAPPSPTAHSVISETSTKAIKDESHNAVTVDVYLVADTEVQVDAIATVKITWDGKVLGNSHGSVEFKSKNQVQVLRTAINFSSQDWADFTSGTRVRPVVEILVQYKDRGVSTQYTIKGTVDSNSDHLLNLNKSYVLVKGAHS